MPARAERSPGEGMPQSDDDTPSGYAPASGARANGRLDPSTGTDRNGTEQTASQPRRQPEGPAEPGTSGPVQGPMTAEPAGSPVRPATLRIVMLYDMDACHGPTGVTRHALAQLERLSRRPGCRAAPDLRPDGPSRRPGVLGRARRALAAGAAGPDARPPAVVAAQGLAADRVALGPGRLDLLPGGVRRAGATGSDGGDQPRRVAAPAVPAPQESRAPGQRLRQGRPDPLGLGVQHPPAHRGVSRVQGSRGAGPQRGRRPVLRAGHPA